MIMSMFGVSPCLLILTVFLRGPSTPKETDVGFDEALLRRLAGLIWDEPRY